MAETDYKSTLQLPKTDFPMKANLPKREPETLKRWDELDLYARLIETRKDAPTWILHDGPPYANGRVHLGTALNKILKDFVVRSRSMMGYRTPFVPGWDCHGMPIEHRVSRELGPRARTISKLELRRLCRAEAEKWIDLQRQDFRRLGCIGDWFNPYLTMAPEYDAAEIAVLRRLVEGGYIYRGLRPVYWCFDCRTALAEAEVEYEDHSSPSIYVSFAFNANLPDAGALAADRADAAELSAAHQAGKLFAVIWTTTPWTLPANLGLSLNESFDYVALKVGDRYYVVAAKLADEVAKACGLNCRKTDSALARRAEGPGRQGHLSPSVHRSRRQADVRSARHRGHRHRAGAYRAGTRLRGLRGRHALRAERLHAGRRFRIVHQRGRRMGREKHLRGEPLDRRASQAGRRAAALGDSDPQLSALLAMP